MNKYIVSIVPEVEDCEEIRIFIEAKNDKEAEERARWIVENITYSVWLLICDNKGEWTGDYIPL